MARMVALLRGINVGNNILKMDRLREICAQIGMKNVQTYVQSGNVVFEASGTAEAWAAKLERKLAGETRLPVTVIGRSSAEITRLFAGNPFINEKDIDTKRLAVSFLQKAPAKSALEALRARDLGKERFHCMGEDIYLHCPDGFAGSKLYILDKVLAMRTTTRNWNTVGKLCQMCSE